MRNRSLKQKPLKVTTYATIGDNKNFCDVNEVLSKFVGKKVKIEINPSEEKMEEFYMLEDTHRLEISGRIKISKTVEEFKNKDIIDICMEYDAWLSDVVNECINLFG